MMTFICPQCQTPITLSPAQFMRCQCGAVYGITTSVSMSTSTSTGISVTTGSKCVIGVHPKREGVPQAFQDAFEDEELVP